MSTFKGAPAALWTKAGEFGSDSHHCLMGSFASEAEEDRLPGRKQGWMEGSRWAHTYTTTTKIHGSEIRFSRWNPTGRHPRQPCHSR